VARRADPGAITGLLKAYGRGDRAALDALLPALYDTLHAIAQSRLRGERADHTLSPTALVNEAYLKLVQVNDIDWKDRGHFLAMAARVMRRILVDHAERRRAVKRGGGADRVELTEDLLVTEEQADDVLRLDLLLERFRTAESRASDVLEYRYFGGLRNEEIAAALDVSVATVERDLRYARAWLAREWTAPE